METRTCLRCGAAFGCGRGPGEERCWCAEKPRIIPVPVPGSDCLCPGCLEKEIERLAGRRAGPEADRS